MSSSSTLTKALLSRAHSPTTTARILTEKIATRPLHLKPSSSSTSDARHKRLLHRASLRRRKKKQKPAPLTAREKRALCIYDIPKAEQKYAIYEPLHRMWIAYIHEVLGENCMPVDGAAAAKLVSADFHGAEIEVVRSRCVSRVGVKGIVVRDSKFVFSVITKGDVLKCVPKEHTVFRFEVPAPTRTHEEVVGTGESGGETEKKKLVFELHGEQFQYRAADRANKKFKTHFLPDL